MQTIPKPPAASGINAYQLRAYRSQAVRNKAAGYLMLGASFVISVLFFYLLASVQHPAVQMLFVVTGAGLEAFKLNSVYNLSLADVAADRRRHFRVVMLTTLVSLIAVFATLSIIHAQNRQSAIAQSETMQAARAQVSATQEKAASLARYADAPTAAEMESRLSQLRAEENRLKASKPLMPADMAQYMTETCAPKSDGRGQSYTRRAVKLCPQWQAMLAQWQADIEAVQAHIRESESYLSGHAEYLGTVQHAATLQGDVARVAESGGAVAEFDNPAFAALAVLVNWLAAPVLWLLRLLGVGEFSLTAYAVQIVWTWGIAILAEYGAQYSLRTAYEAEKTIGNNGALDLHQITLADVERSHEILRLAPSLLGLPAPVPSAAPASALGFAPSTKPRGRLLSMLRNDISAPNLSAPESAPSEESADRGAPSSVVYRDRKRVPPELSQQAGRGRVGKVDSCRDCGTDFPVETYNATRCKACSEKAQASFRAHQARLKAKA